MIIINPNYYDKPEYKVNIPKPITIRYNVYDSHRLYHNMPNKVYLPNGFNHMMDYFVPMLSVDDMILDCVESIMKSRVISILHCFMQNQTTMIQEFFRENESFRKVFQNKMDFINGTIKTKLKYYLDDKLNIMILTENATFVSSRDCLVYFRSNYDVLYAFNDGLTHQLYFKTQDNLTFGYNVTQNNFKGIVKTPTENETMTMTIDDECKLFIKFDYVNTTKNKPHSINSNSLKLPNGSYVQTVKENDRYVNKQIVHNYNSINKQKFCRVECEVMDMDSGGKDGIRYRGSYSELKNVPDNKVINKVVKKDGNTIYEKKDEEVLIDSINNVKIRDTILIVWKAVKTESGEWRVLKLALHPDAQCVRPIDELYWDTYEKERCDRAIVMDIQLPVKDKEISLVPEEMEVVSCIYANTVLKYKVGQEVKPDSYESDPDKGCSHGIHYFRNRSAVFAAYIDN